MEVQVVIGGPEARFRGVRDLISELALLPVEGGARVAIIERFRELPEKSIPEADTAKPLTSICM